MSKPGLRRFAKTTIIEEPLRLAAGTILVWEVGGEKQAIITNKIGGTLKEMRQEHAARCDIGVLAKICCDRMIQARRAIHCCEPLCMEQHQLAPMAEDHLEAWHAVERARENETKEWTPAS